MREFAEWDSFYVIVGSAAGALIGLQFVVLTLIAQRPTRPQAEAGQAFSTPTVLHFCVVLLLAAMLRAPWQNAIGPAICWGVVGVLGVVYAGVVTKRMRAQNMYDPEFVDWLSYVIFPVVAYAILLASAFFAATQIRSALFGVAVADLMLLFIGIYNAWDTVTFHVFKSAAAEEDIPEQQDQEGE